MLEQPCAIATVRRPLFRPMKYPSVTLEFKYTVQNAGGYMTRVGDGLRHFCLNQVTLKLQRQTTAMSDVSSTTYAI